MIEGRVALGEVVQQGFEQVRGQFLEQLQKPSIGQISLHSLQPTARNTTNSVGISLGDFAS